MTCLLVRPHRPPELIAHTAASAEAEVLTCANARLRRLMGGARGAEGTALPDAEGPGTPGRPSGLTSCGYRIAFQRVRSSADGSSMTVMVSVSRPVVRLMVS